MKPVWDVSMSLLLVRMTQPVPYLPFPPANYDYTHINFRGGRHLAGLLYETLIYGKEQYERRKAYEAE